MYVERAFAEWRRERVGAGAGEGRLDANMLIEVKKRVVFEKVA